MMPWYKPDVSKQVKTIHVPQLQFLGEQDGVPETELKTRLVAALRANLSVTRAYLAKVAYGPSKPISIALCLRSSKEPNADLMKAIVNVFAEMFRTDEHLDILFLSDGQEVELMKVCKPFFLQTH